MESDWGKELKAMILKYARLDNLTRVTGTGFIFDTWPFFSYKISNGKIDSKEDLKHLSMTSDNQAWNIFASPLGGVYPSSIL